jgi:hypothetical protein
LRKINSDYSENYAKCIFCEQKEEILKVKEGGVYIKDGASKINVSLRNKAQK